MKHKFTKEEMPKLREQLKYKNYDMPGILAQGHYYTVIRTGCTVYTNGYSYFIEVMGDTGYKRCFSGDNIWDNFDADAYIKRQRYLKLKNIFVHLKDYE